MKKDILKLRLDELICTAAKRELQFCLIPLSQVNRVRCSFTSSYLRNQRSRQNIEQ